MEPLLWNPTTYLSGNLKAGSLFIPEPSTDGTPRRREAGLRKLA